MSRGVWTGREVTELPAGTFTFLFTDVEGSTWPAGPAYTATVSGCFWAVQARGICHRLPQLATMGLHKGSIACSQSRQRARGRVGHGPTASLLRTNFSNGQLALVAACARRRGGSRCAEGSRHALVTLRAAESTVTLVTIGQIRARRRCLRLATSCANETETSSRCARPTPRTSASSASLTP